jgi:predicted nucleotidyltransferase/DNA-binding XRE family transcriptional regulator
MMRTPDVLRAARAGAGFTQAELASRAGTSQPAIARYERGAATPSIATLARLVAACGRRLVFDTEPEAGRAAVSRSAVRERRRELLAIARRHGARNVRVFGSTARGEAGPESDVDLLVDLAPGRTLLDIAAFRREASALLGTAVDVATTDMLRESIREGAERDAVPV